MHPQTLHHHIRREASLHGQLRVKTLIQGRLEGQKSVSYEAIWLPGTVKPSIWYRTGIWAPISAHNCGWKCLSLWPIMMWLPEALVASISSRFYHSITFLHTLISTPRNLDTQLCHIRMVGITRWQGKLRKFREKKIRASTMQNKTQFPVSETRRDIVSSPLKLNESRIVSTEFSTAQNCEGILKFNCDPIIWIGLFPGKSANFTIILFHSLTQTLFLTINSPFLLTNY